MRRQLLLGLAALLIAPLTPAALVAAPAQAAPLEIGTPATEHPRLLFSAADVPEIRQRVSVPGSVHAAAWERVQGKADGHLLKVHPELVRTNKDNCLLNLEGLECPYNLQNEMPTYLIELGMAYQLSGDEKYGRRAIDLLAALGDADFPFWTMEKDLGIGDLLEGVGLAFDWTYQMMTVAERAKIVGDITRMQDLLFVRPLFEYTNEASTYPGSNWMGVTAGGAGLTLLAIRGEPGAPTEYTSGYNAKPSANSNVPAWPVRTYTFEEYLNKALLQVRTYSRGGVDLAGASHEGTTYAAYGLKNSIPFALAARRDGLGDLFDGTGLPATHCWGGTQYFCLPLGSEAGGTGMASVSRWLAFEQLPGEGQNFVPLNDSQRSQVGVDLQAQLFAINPDDGVAQWLWKRTVGSMGTDVYAQPEPAPQARESKCTQATEPSSFIACDLFNMHGHVWAILFYKTPGETPEVDPETVSPLSVHHSERGLVDARTGFAGEKREVISTFEARRNGIPHFQYDIGNFTLYGEGGRWATDPGYDCAACDNKPEYEHAGAYADQHNVVVIDGKARTQSADSRYALILNNPAANQSVDSFVNAPNVSLAHADLRYAYGGYPGGYAAPYAGRDHLFSRAPGRPVILGITDHVQRDSLPHTYRWQMLTNNDNVVVPNGSGFTIQQGASGAVLSGRVAAGGSPLGDLSVLVKPQLITSPTDDRGKVFPLVYTETPAQLTMDQLAVMALTPAGETPATTETLRVSGANAIGVTWKGVQDVIVRKLKSAASVSGLIATDAAIAKFTRNLANATTPETAETVMRGGTRLFAFDREYVQVSGSASTVAVSADTVQATGAAANSYRVYAPQPIRSVTVNGAVVLACREGSYLTFPCAATTALTLAAPTSAPATDEIEVSATLTAAGLALAGRSVTLSVGPLSVPAVTDEAGVARAELRLDLDPGSYPVRAVFSATGGYSGSTAQATLTVTPDATNVIYTGQTVARGETVRVSAQLTEDGGVPMAARVVVFTIGSTAVAATTDSGGRATATVSVGDHGRSQIVTTDFAGDARHAGSRDSDIVLWGH